MAFQQVSQPGRDGAVLPILHLNGYKIANPTMLARMPDEEMRSSFSATATSRCSSRAMSRMAMHRRMADALDDGHWTAFAASSRPRATRRVAASGRDGR